MGLSAAVIGGIFAGVGTLAGGIAEGVTQASAAKSAASRAKRQRDEQRNIQVAALEREKFERQRTKDRKAAADLQSETESRIAITQAGGASAFSTILGAPTGSKTILGS